MEIHKPIAILIHTTDHTPTIFQSMSLLAQALENSSELIGTDEIIPILIKSSKRLTNGVPFLHTNIVHFLKLLQADESVFILVDVVHYELELLLGDFPASEGAEESSEFRDADLSVAVRVEHLERHLELCHFALVDQGLRLGYCGDCIGGFGSLQRF